MEEEMEGGSCSNAVPMAMTARDRPNAVAKEASSVYLHQQQKEEKRIKIPATQTAKCTSGRPFQIGNPCRNNAECQAMHCLQGI